MNIITRVFKGGILAVLLLIMQNSLYAQDKPAESAAELAKKLANPIASLISLPFQNNLDVGIGDHNGSKNVLNVQPVIPFKMTDKLNLITRWILPIVSQFDVSGEGTKQSGIGDAVISAFVSPTGGSITWGVGPAIVVPTATNDYLGGKKFAVGPSVVVLKQSNGWTYGMLANHVFSVAGSKSRPDFSATFINPFLTYNWKSGAGLTLVAEYTHEWKSEGNIFVVIPTLSTVTKFGKQTVSFGIGPRFHFAPSGGASYGFRGSISLLFPK